MRSGEFDIEALRNPRAFPHAVDKIEVRETHLSWVVLTGQYAYKIKKAVRYDFIDSSSLARRKFLCDEELRLNRRLARDLYQEVVPIGMTQDGPAVGRPTDVREYAVRMRQFEAANELCSLLERGEVTQVELEDLACRIADFHMRAAVASARDPFGDFERIRETVWENLTTLISMSRDAPYLHDLNYLATWTREVLARNRANMDFRRENGSVRECHGDLHSRNIVRWQGRLLPFDCLEFDPALRWIDTANEIAFLHMDLIGYERRDLASAFLSRYLEVCGDYESLPLLKFYAVYRALVRAKVDAIQLAKAAGNGKDPKLGIRLESRIRLARDLVRDADPVLVIMNGVSGSGKSWLSQALVPALAAIRIRSDLERKRIAGLGPGAATHSAIGGGLYRVESTHRTYARLVECAEHALTGGQDVIVDAAFLDSTERELFMGLARRHRCRFLILSCSAPREVLRARIRGRAMKGGDPSEAGLDVLEHQESMPRAFTPQERPHVVDIDTSNLTLITPLTEKIRTRLAQTGCP